MKLYKPLVLRHLLIIILAAGMVLPGCAGINPKSAEKLAQQGIIASKSIGKSYQVTRDRLDTYVEGEYLLSALVAGYSAPNQKTLANINIVRDELKLRKKMFDELAKVYASLEALSVYGATGDTEKALVGLTSSINDYSNSKAVFKGSSIPDAVGKIVRKAGGKIADIYKRRRIKKGSENIRVHLEAIAFLLNKQSEIKAMTTTREEIARNRLKAANALWEADIGLANSILRDQVRSYGLDLNTKKAAMASSDPKLKNAVKEVIKVRHNKERKAVKASYIASVNAIISLIAAHKKLEEGEDISLTSIHSFLATVNDYVDLIKKLEGERSK